MEPHSLANAAVIAAGPSAASGRPGAGGCRAERARPALRRRLPGVSSPADLTGPWRAPIAAEPIRATVHVPGSKSETARALVLAALAGGPSVITNGLDARDTRLMRDALRGLGVRIEETGHTWRVTPPATFMAGATIDCGLSGTVMRFVPPIAALAPGTVAFDGDEQAYDRPMQAILTALATLGAGIEGDALPFRVTGRPDLPGGTVTVDASASSQFVSGLLLAGARFAHGLDLRHEGAPVPSEPYLQMTVAMLRDRGVQVDDSTPNRWVIAPGPIAPRDTAVAPDLANAAPFLAAAAITGGSVTVPDWPVDTRQAGDAVRDVLALFGADVRLVRHTLTVAGTDRIHGVDVNLRDASELVPVVAAVAALADGTSHIRGVAHIRGHETDRLSALATELERLGASVHESRDGLTIHPRLLGGDTWHTYADHRMAQAGALLGLVVADVVLDDVSCTAKTMPEFVELWTRMLSDSDRASGGSGSPESETAPA
jgi:3-phosphoshikimate 1-carboxyvinyltransferase